MGKTHKLIADYEAEEVLRADGWIWVEEGWFHINWNDSMNDKYVTLEQAIAENNKQKEQEDECNL